MIYEVINSKPNPRKEKELRRSYNTCSNCFGRVVMSAFSSGACEICGNEIIHESTPCVKLCYKCARRFNKCRVCGGDMD